MLSTTSTRSTLNPVSDSAGCDTVYIVEDDVSTRDALQELIYPTGVKVESFGSAEDFLQGIDHRNPGCLLVDEKLPGMSGSDLLRLLQQQGVQVSAVLVTGHATIPTTVNAMRMGAVDVLEKPCCDNMLCNAIEQALVDCRKQTRRSSAHRDSTTRIERLSPSESEVLKHVLDGMPNKQIARQLGVCIRTVEARRSRIYKTMGVQSVAELTRACVAAQFIDA